MTQDEQLQYVLDATARITRRIIDRVRHGDLPTTITKDDLLQQIVGEAVKEYSTLKPYQGANHDKNKTHTDLL